MSLRLPAAAIGIVATLLTVHLVGGAQPSEWIWHRARIADGELWRVLSAHWVHADGAHVVANALGAALILILLGRRRASAAPLLITASMLSVSAALWFGAPQVQSYCGASGWLAGWLMGGLLLAWHDERQLIYPLLALAWCAKLLAEFWVGDSVVVSSSWPTWSGAHLAEAAGGVFAAWIASKFSPSKSLARTAKITEPVMNPSMALPNRR